MPAIMNICASFALGSSVAFVSRNSPGLREGVLGWPLLAVLAFQAIVVTPVATYLFRFYPQWSMLYLFDPQIFTQLQDWIGVLSAAAIVFNFVAASSGYALARVAVLTPYRWPWRLIAALLGASILALLWLFGERVVFLGEHDAFWSGQARIIVATLPGWLGIGTYLGGFLCVVWLHTLLTAKRHKKEAR